VVVDRDPPQLMPAAYVHASDEDLKTGTDALGKIYKLK